MMQTTLGLVSRSGAARILDCSEGRTRNLERDGRLQAVGRLGNRPLFRLEEVQALAQAEKATKGDQAAA